MVKFKIVLYDTERKIGASYEYEAEDEYADSQLYSWKEGNFSCDCNRSIILSKLIPGYEERENCSDGIIQLLSFERIY